MKEDKCKICRRLNQKLFLKGEKCLSPHCPFIKRPFPPGPKKKRRRFRQSEYGKELFEKQKLRNYYGLTERQFSRYVKEVLGKRGKVEDAALLLIKKLESRLDNVVFKMGLAKSRKESRQIVSHNHVLVNGQPVNIPSFVLKKGSKIELKKQKKDKVLFKDLMISMKSYQPPQWLKVDKKNLSSEITGQPTLDEVGVPVDIASIFEFYSR